jgi:hypothetical protein
MANYTDVFIGFIDDKSKFIKRKKKCTDNVLLNHIYKFLQEYCIIQYVTIEEFHNCRFCHEIFRNLQLVYYDGLNRYIFPDYLYHYIKHHEIEIDEKLISILKSIYKLDYI